MSLVKSGGPAVKNNKTGDQNEYCKQVHILCEQNESRIRARRARLIYWYDSMTTVSHLSAHINAAQSAMNDGDYSAAYSELEAAAERFVEYRGSINETFNQCISSLSTLSCRAAAPHPVALDLVRLRQQITS